MIRWKIENHAIKTADRKTNEKCESKIQNLWDNIKCCEGEEREKGIKSIFEEIMAENFPNQSPEVIDIQG